MLGNLHVCDSFPHAVYRLGTEGSQVSRFLVKGTKASLVLWSPPIYIRKRPLDLGAQSDTLLDCELLEGRDQGPED